MLDVALIEKCADPSLTPAIVEQFVAAAGSDDPLAITVKSGGRLVLIPKPQSPEAALDIVREHFGKASVRVGLTQYPAGVGMTDIAQLDAALVEPCENLKRGTALFAKVARIVTKWYGSPTSKEVTPQMFEDAVYAWRTGEFEGTKVFQAEDPGGATFLRGRPLRKVQNDEKSEEVETMTAEEYPAQPAAAATDADAAEMRIDLSRIGGR
ncbi:TraH family protein [Shinella sp. CPCC 101442]|uniref:TraH family protein n=1 Tax=Shinella sp. CPCC 101442 TaxID=2932265 RepID=UPI0021524FC7|nr:TraH family protein [Shinella sp. CPCC 101442]MCR6502076.1 TraH family protein [Shinella sp. CPCC 101442]